LANEDRGYYAIIPATVRYDKSLSPNAKLLYGEITALCNQAGYCWASNNYFAELYDVQRSSISNWIKALSNAGYIKVEYVYADGKPNIEKRKIFITDLPYENLSREGGGQKTRKRILQANITKAAAADQRQSEIEKPPEKAAAAEEKNNKTEPLPKATEADIESLKSHFKHLDPSLHSFDDSFYLEVLSFLEKHDLGLEYVSWFYKLC